MIDPRILRRLLFIALFIAIGFLVAFLRLLPLNGGLPGHATPDLILALAFAWAIRRPDFVPVGVLALVLLMGDLLLMRPPGLWPLLAVVGLEVIRSRVGATDKMSFTSEWLLVAVIYGGMLVLERLIEGIFMTGLPGAGATALRFAATMVAYPFVVVVSVWGLGVTRPLPGELEAEARGL